MNVRRATNDKLPVTPSILKAALTHINAQPGSEPVTLGIILMFVGFLRQSSVAPATVATFDPTRHLTHADTWPTPRGLVVRIKWSKTIQRAADLKTIVLPPTADPKVCPIKAHAACRAASPSLQPTAPLLAFKDGNPVTARYLARRWTAALQAAGYSPSAYSLHSLRKGGASYAYNEGDARLNDVMAQGTWQSAAVRTYIKPHEGAPNKVHAALAAL